MNTEHVTFTPKPRKPSLKQRKALNKLVETGGNVSKAMVLAGYSPETAKTPQKLTESKGFIALANELGLTDDLIARSLVEDIAAKPGNRVAELALALKAKGLLIDRNQNETIAHIRVTFGK